MGSRGVRGPCSALFLLLLLLLPPPLFRAGSFQHPRPDWRMFHHLGPGSRRAHHRHGPGTRHHWRQGQAQSFCKAKFDLYYIIDKSGSVNNNWGDLYGFVEDTVKQLQNQHVKMSLITYSTFGETVMPLTADSEEIRKGLAKLEKVVPEGHTFMQEGFKRANEQMERTSAGPDKVPNVVIAITDGTLVEQAFQETLKEAEKSRKMGTTIYTVGVADFSKRQITAIADSKAHTFAVDNGFKAMKSIVGSLTKGVCTQVTSVKPSTVCAGESYEVVVHGTGFQNTKGQDQVICRFKFGQDKVVDEKPISMDKTTITCPGPKIEKPGEKVSVEVSLDNGNNFHSSEEASYTTTSCVKPEVGPAGLWGPAPVPAPLQPLRWGCLGIRERGQMGGQLVGKRPPRPSPAADISLICRTVGDIPLPQFSWYWLLPLLLLPLLCGLCYLCFRKPKKPPEKKPEKEPEKPPPVCPTVIVCCSGCQGLCGVCGMHGSEDDLGALCGLAQPSCNRVPLMWCPRRVQGRCLSLPLMQSQCAPCSPKICFPPSQECLPLAQAPCSSKLCLPPSQECCPLTCSSRCHYLPASCSRPPSRMLPLLCRPARAHRRPHFCLPPP
ncbi:anthrax toxin receptor-like [Eulemur rufifrons]|uniref:anthrax toxin receptor-like n=1 Tax=Eulemur rufifrons TaxID=859984 RepID=UPI00374447D6